MPARAFGVKDLQAFNQADQEQMRKEAKLIHRELSHQQYQDLQAQSKAHLV